jgi:hypothetical protein
LLKRFFSVVVIDVGLLLSLLLKQRHTAVFVDAIVLFNTAGARKYPNQRNQLSNYVL